MLLNLISPSPEVLSLDDLIVIIENFVFYPIFSFVDAMDHFYLFATVSYWDLLIYSTFIWIVMRVLN